MVTIKIVDLPKNYREWKYAPSVPTLFTVRYARMPENSVVRATVQSPLTLEIGDCVIFAEVKNVPRAFLDITKGCSSHQSYAIICEEEEATKQGTGHSTGSPGHTFVG